MHKIYNALLQYLEINRLGNLNVRTGWRQRLQNSYLAHYLQQKTPLPGPGKAQKSNVEEK